MELCGAFGAGSSRSAAAPFDRHRSVGGCGCQRDRVVVRCMNLTSGGRQEGMREGLGVDNDVRGTVLKVRDGCVVTAINPQTALTGPGARSRKR